MSDVKRLYGDKGQYLGYTLEDSVNVRAYDNKGKCVGNYNKNANQTYNANGSRSTFGNSVVNKIVSK